MRLGRAPRASHPPETAAAAGLAAGVAAAALVAAALVTGMLAAGGCGEEAGAPVALTSEAALPVAPVSAPRFAGTWRVEGVTKDLASGDTRTIHGMIVLAEAGDAFSVSAELETQYPAEGGPVDTHVIGTGSGRRNADGLQGSAETQLVMGAVPGLHTEFAFAPREVGPRLQSVWEARLREDGVLLVELENRPRQGETYSPTHTNLRGTRVASEAGGE